MSTLNQLSILLVVCFSTSYESILIFLQDSVGASSFTISRTSGQASGHEELLNGMELAAATEDKETHSFEIDPSQVFFSFLLKVGNH